VNAPILDAGGFLGLGLRNVAVPMDENKIASTT